MMFLNFSYATHNKLQSIMLIAKGSTQNQYGNISRRVVPHSESFLPQKAKEMNEVLKDVDDE